MNFAPNRCWHAELKGGGLDMALAIASEIAIDVIERFFWSALLLFWIKAVT
jgi:hypothetical protein